MRNLITPGTSGKPHRKSDSWGVTIAVMMHCILQATYRIHVYFEGYEDDVNHDSPLLLPEFSLFFLASSLCAFPSLHLQ